jgi:hypothetical protein
MSLSAPVSSRLQHQHEAIHDLLNGFSEEQLKQRIDYFTNHSSVEP